MQRLKNMRAKEKHLQGTLAPDHVGELGIRKRVILNTIKPAYCNVTVVRTIAKHEK